MHVLTALMTTGALLGSYQHPLRLPDGPAAARAPAVRPAMALAQRAWRPSCGRLELSSDPAPAGLAGDAGGWAWAGGCLIHLRRHLLWLGGPDLCEAILHEAGHVAGRGHSSDPRSIMYPSHLIARTAGRIEGDRHHRAVRAVTWTGVDRRCLRAYHANGED